MIGNEYAEMATRRLGARCPEVVEAALLVHRGPATGGGGLGRLFGRKTVASRLRTSNLLVLTPTSVRLYSLGGRTGMDPKDELAGWPRGSIAITSSVEDLHTYFASSGTSLDQKVHRLRLTGADLDLQVDVMANAGLDDDDLYMLDAEALDPASGAAETDPDVREGMAGLQELSAETDAAVAAFVAAALA